MTSQRRLLHAMLAVLGLAAVVGVAAIFMGNEAIIGRIAATLAVAAIAIALAIPASRRFERQESRVVGIAALGAIVVGFMLAAISIWIERITLTSEWRFFQSTLVYIPCAAVAMAFLSLLQKPYGWIAGRVGIVLTALVFTLWILAIWFEPWRGGASFWYECAISANIIAGAGPAICLSLIGRAGERRWRWIGVVAGVVAIALGLYAQWSRPDIDLMWFWAFLIVSVAVAAINLVVQARLAEGHRWMIGVTTGSILVTAVAALVINFDTRGFDQQSPGAFMTRVFAASAIVTTCSALAVAVLMAFGRRMLITQSSALSELRAVRLACPRCQKQQEAPTGESRCIGCGLIFLLCFADPRCAKCGYRLLDLHSGICPECGTVAATEESPLAKAASVGPS